MKSVPPFSFRKRLSIFAVAVFAVAEILSAASKPKSHSQFEALPLMRSGQNHLLVRAKVNGRSAVLLVDSGAPATLIDSRRRSDFNLAGVGNNPELPTSVLINGVADKLAIVHSLRLGALDIVDIPVVVANVSAPHRVARMLREQQIDGILGVDVLFGTKAVMDCKDQVLILNLFPETGGRDPQLNLRGFQKMPIYVNDGFNLFVNSSVNGTRTRLLVDTGAVMTTLHLPFVRQLRIPYYKTAFTSSGVNRKADAVSVAEIKRLSVGSVNMTSKAIGVADLNWLFEGKRPQFSSPPVVGLLGAEVLKSHHAIIDFGTRTLYLKQ